MALEMELYPDIIVDYIVKELSYEGTAGVLFDKLWELVSLKVKVDHLYKKIIYSWLSKNEKIEILKNDGTVIEPKPIKYADVENTGSFIRVNTDYLWISLTGAPKENNPIGGMAFDLLVEIAKSRGEGIDSLSLTKATGQDSRSLTQRIKALGTLVKKLPIIKNGRTLSLLILNEFYDPTKNNTVSVNEKNDDIIVSSTDIRLRIIGSVKNAKHGIRQIIDLRRELELDKTDRLKVTYRSAVNYLVEKKCLSKVLVIAPSAPTKKFLSLKYLKDYVPKTDPSENDDEPQEEDEGDEIDDDFIDDELKELEGEEQPTSLSNVDDLQVTSLEDDQQVPALNRFFPLQNQVFEIVDKSGPAGLSSTAILESIFGKGYWRLFSKMIGSYTSGKLIPHLANYGIIRHYDFKGRTKFYRYLTKPNLSKISNQPLDPNGSVLPSFKPTKTTLTSLNKKHYTPLIGGVNLVDDNGTTKIHWHGQGGSETDMVKVKKSSSNLFAGVDNKGDDSTPKKKRGRPKKGEEASASNTPKPKRMKQKLKPKDLQEDEIKDENKPDVEIPTANGDTKEPSQERDQRITPQVADIHSEMVQEAIEPVDSSRNHSQDNAKDMKADTGKNKDEKPGNVLTISEVQGSSFRAIERRTAILKILEENDGVHINDFTFVEALRALLNSTVDKRAFKGDISSLISQGKVRIEEGFKSRDNMKPFSIVIGPTATQESIKSLTDEIKGKKTLSLKKHDEVQNVELEFYDEEFGKSFNEVPNSPPKKRRRTKKPVNTEMVEELQREAIESGVANVQADTTSEETIKNEPKKKATSNSTAKGAVEKDVTKPKRPRKVATTRKPVSSKVKQEPHPEDDWEINSKKSRKPHTTRKKRNASHLNSADTMLLFKAVIICKTIKENQIHWDKIAGLFDDIPTEILRKKWPRIRMMMGPEGSKSARRTWKRILLASVREGKITLAEVEELDLETLVKLWQDAEMMGGVEEVGESLFANYEENFTHYNFVKSSASNNAFSYDSNSMVQREQFLVDKSFTYSENDEATIEATSVTGHLEQLSTKATTKDIIKHVIISILASGKNANIQKLPFLETFDKKELEEVFLEMTRRKEILVGADSKLFLGETLTHILDDISYDFSLTKINHFQHVLKNVFDANKGLILNSIFDNSFMVPIVELINQQKMNLIRIDHYRKEVLTGYEARTIEREKLDCDIILSKNSIPIENYRNNTPLVPIGKPCSKIWIDVEGKINKIIWNKVNRIVLTSILSQPGITIIDLYWKLSPLLSPSELADILKWLQDAQSIAAKDFNGLWLLPQWYTIFGV